MENYGTFEYLILAIGFLSLVLVLVNGSYLILKIKDLVNFYRRKQKEKKSLELKPNEPKTTELSIIKKTIKVEEEEEEIEVDNDEDNEKSSDTSSKNIEVKKEKGNSLKTGFIAKVKSKLEKISLPKIKYNFWLVLILNVFLLVGINLLLDKTFDPGAAVINTYPSQNEYWNDYSKPLEIEFSRPIRPEVLELNFNDEVEGEWIYEKSFSFLPFTRKVKFIPSESFEPETKYKVYVVNFNKYDIGEYPFDFYSAKLPKITSISPSDQEVDVMPDREIEFKLDIPDGNFVDWEFKLTPEEEYRVEKLDDTTYKLNLEQQLKQTTQYEIDVYRATQIYDLETREIINTGDKIKIHETFFKTIKAPLVETYEPEGTGVIPTDTIRVVFDEPMNQEEVEQAFSIEPAIEGEIIWEDERTFVYNPAEDLPKESKYKVTFDSGITSQAGGKTEIPIEFNFETVGKVKVNSFTPSNGVKNVDVNTNIVVRFDQEVDKSSAQSKFSISPNINGTFSWKENSMVFSPSGNLSYSTNYKVSIAPGVKTVYGINSDKSFSTSFTTRSSTVILSVAYDAQNHAFACNSVATSMVLTYKGSPTTESQVYNNAGAGPQGTLCRSDWGNSGCSYPNPFNGWVSNYGVYWPPIKSYIESRGYQTQYVRNLTAALREVEKGNPVIVWWQNGQSVPTNISYTATDGTSITAVNGMHSVVIIGYQGTPENPTRVYYHDPYFGATLSRSPSSFDWLWSTWRLGGALPASYSRIGLAVK